MAEDTIVLTEDTGAANTPSKQKKNRPHARNRLMAVVGALILLFAAIGFVTTVVLTANWVVAKIDNQEEKDKFADFIYPLVMLDPPAFDSPSKLSPTTVLSAGAWNFIMNADKSKYEKDEFGFLTVPQSDLEVYATQLFGEGLTFEHQSIGDAEFSFSYNTEEGVYYISESSLYFTYVPRVTQIDYRDNQIHLRVEYVAPDFMWRSAHHDSGEKVTKIMEYILEENGSGSYKIIAVETILSGTDTTSNSGSSSSSVVQNSSSAEEE